MDYETWKRVNKGTSIPDVTAAHTFAMENPAKEAEYKKRRVAEQGKKSEIAAITDRSARLKAIQDNIELFQ